MGHIGETGSIPGLCEKDEEMMTESLDCRLGAGVEASRARPSEITLIDMAAALYRRLSEILVLAGDVLIGWQQRAQERSHLLMLDDRMLRDIGLTRADVEHEANKPFWRP
ncbi:MAG: DUF1127 domain-containing protein [Pseudomonadota bacterium]